MATKGDVGIGGGNGTDDSGGGSEGSEGDNKWIELLYQKKKQIDEWMLQSSILSKLKALLAEKLLATRPVGPQSPIILPRSGYVLLYWRLVINKNILDEIGLLFKKSDLWKPLGITAGELWSFVDTPRVLQFLLYQTIGQILDKDLIEKSVNARLFDYHQDNQQKIAEMLPNAVLSDPRFSSEVGWGGDEGFSIYARGTITYRLRNSRK